MATTRSARGEVVNFELIAIKQQLASAPIPVSVDERRRFIDEKDGVRTKQTVDVVETPVVETEVVVDALAVAQESAEISAKAAKK